MRVTEEEAKEKLCPLIQRNCVGKGCMMFVEAPSIYGNFYRCGMALGGR